METCLINRNWGHRFKRSQLFLDPYSLSPGQRLFARTHITHPGFMGCSKAVQGKTAAQRSSGWDRVQGSRDPLASDQKPAPSHSHLHFPPAQVLALGLRMLSAQTRCSLPTVVPDSVSRERGELLLQEHKTP